MLKSFKYRIYPTDDQIVKLSNIFGQVRFVCFLPTDSKERQKIKDIRKSLDYACGVETQKSLAFV